LILIEERVLMEYLEEGNNMVWSKKPAQEPMAGLSIWTCCGRNG